MKLLLCMLPDPCRRSRATALAASVAVATVIATAAEVRAQDTTVIGGPGSDTGVTVNLDVLDGGTAPGTRSSSGRVQLRPPRSAGDQPQPATPTQSGEMDDAAPGEFVRGPSGAILRFPPTEAPRSRLTVDPNRLKQQAERRQQAAQRGASVARPQLTKPSAPEPSATAPSASAPSASERAASESADIRTQVPASPDLPESPAIPEAPSTGTPSTGTGDVSETARTRAAERPAAPDAVTPGTKPTPEERDLPTDTAASESPQESATAAVDSTPEAEAAAEAEAAPEPEPEPAPERAPETTQEPDSGGTQTAARTPATEEAPGGETPGVSGTLRLDFDSGTAALSDAARAALDRLAAAMKDAPEARIQFMAFADGGGDGASRARRLSLSRALSVRSYLIDQGIRSTRMDVRALGDTAESGPLNRVDIVPANR
jgi:outer membrane protein OmpA-like peptidoglycan-associated protein